MVWVLAIFDGAFPKNLTRERYRKAREEQRRAGAESAGPKREKERVRERESGPEGPRTTTTRMSSSSSLSPSPIHKRSTHEAIRESARESERARGDGEGGGGRQREAFRRG